MSSVRFENVALPLVNDIVSVPPSLPVPGLLDRPISTVPSKLVSTVPDSFSTETVSPKSAPAVTLAGGSVVIASLVVEKS